MLNRLLSPLSPFFVSLLTAASSATAISCDDCSLDTHMHLSYAAPTQKGILPLFLEGYPDPLADEILSEANIELVRLTI